MKIRRIVKTRCAFALAAAVLLTGLGILRTQAAGSIETDRDCSLTVSVEISGADGSNEAYLDDFNQMVIPVSVYKVATVDKTGQKFTGLDPFNGLDFSIIGPETTAADWQELAREAEAILQSKIESENPPDKAGYTEIMKTENSTAEESTAEDSTAEDNTAAAPGEIKGLTPGMYLVVPQAVDSPDHSVKYTFTPYLTALPSSDYTLTGTGSDTWDYDITIGLKPNVTPLYGKLNITKNLEDYNSTLGRATFVFQITGVDKNGVTKYEEVESIDFTAPGSKTITLENIPAGLNVTVTEVYSGASYQIVGDDEQTVMVVSDEAVTLGGQEEASVSFTNRYDGGNRTGYGVNNRFESDGQGGWIWENPTTPAGE